MPLTLFFSFLFYFIYKFQFHAPTVHLKNNYLFRTNKKNGKERSWAKSIYKCMLNGNK